MNKKVGLIILDGWGLGDQSSSDAIFNAHTPFFDHLMQNYPNATLQTSGEAVGLPDGQMGNSEVGHLNIGAGRIVYQELTRINKSIRDGELQENPVLKSAFEKAKESGRKLHFLGLVSDGGVHSSQAHLHALCQMAQNAGVENYYVHAITDGRDCDPKSGLGFIENLEQVLEQHNGQLATLIGRYYAMDRDKRWERVAQAYHLLVNGKGEPAAKASTALRASYDAGITDEFVLPHVISPEGCISPNDIVVFFNFRTDRPRELTTVLTQEAFPEQNMSPLQLDFYTMTNYDELFKNIHVLFEKDKLQRTLGEVVAAAGKSQVRIAETEKYPHVTFFFNGGRELPFANEDRLLISSPKVATYDLQPEMSAPQVTSALIEHMQKNTPDFICLNFANPDMVGHTGVYAAIVKAVETVDQQLQQIVEKGLQLGYEFLIIADHGNADFAVNPDGSPNTAHSLNPVPVILVSDQTALKLQDGILADVAPTLLARMGLDQPNEMTGKNLIVS
ncbi:MAG: 2,3-bisphosphoglycerate-independent phosphoglycerate mutase [Flavobacteriales bacterium]